jgi:hypothetical protein
VGAQSQTGLRQPHAKQLETPRLQWIGKIRNRTPAGLKVRSHAHPGRSNGVRDRAPPFPVPSRVSRVQGDENRAQKCSTHTLFSFIKKTLDTLDVLDEALTIKPFAPSPPWPEPGPRWSMPLLPEVFRR